MALLKLRKITELTQGMKYPLPLQNLITRQSMKQCLMSLTKSVMGRRKVFATALVLEEKAGKTAVVIG